MSVESQVYSFPTNIDFGAGAIANLPKWIMAHAGTKVLLVTDPRIPSLPLFKRVTGILDASGVPWELFSDISPDPKDEDVHAGADFFNQSGCNLIVGLGGGSALDGAKGIQLMSSHSGTVLDYDAAAGGSDRIDHDMPVCIAVPTTAGAGSEVGRSFVVVDTRRNVKIVVFSPFLMPRLAILDPELHVGMPRRLTAAAGMDALTHNVEALLSKGFHPMADSIALGGIRLVACSLKTAFDDPNNLKARGEMALAAAMGATAFQKGLGVVHSLAHPCSTIAGVHHGLANGILLEHGLLFNRDVSENAMARLARAISLPGSTNSGLADAAIDWVSGLRASVEIPARLRDVGVASHMLEEMEAQAFADGCHQCNPKPVTPADIHSLYEKAF